MGPEEEGRKDEGPQEEQKSNELSGANGPEVEEKLCTAVIWDILKDDQQLRNYLDALPDLVRRGIKRVAVKNEGIMAEAGEPTEGRDIHDELDLNWILRHGYDHWRTQIGGTCFYYVKESDLIRYRYYYAPNEEPPEED